MEDTDENYFTLIDIFTCTKDIIVSVNDFAVSTRQFFIDLWIEFYLQLTTISWLSVKNVQKSTKAAYQEPKAGSDDDHKKFGLLENFPNIGSVFSFPTFKDHDEVEILTDSDLLTKAEERVRLANEMLANNTKARARLAMTEIFRWENFVFVERTCKIILIPENLPKKISPKKYP